MQSISLAPCPTPSFQTAAVLLEYMHLEESCLGSLLRSISTADPIVEKVDASPLISCST